MINADCRDYCCNIIKNYKDIIFTYSNGLIGDYYKLEISKEDECEFYDNTLYRKKFDGKWTHVADFITRKKIKKFNSQDKMPFYLKVVIEYEKWNELDIIK